MSKQPCGGNAEHSFSSFCKFMNGFTCECGIVVRTDSKGWCETYMRLAHTVLKPMDDPLRGTIDIPSSLMEGPGDG